MIAIYVETLLFLPRPEPPDWAVEAGLPYPEPRESFVDYTERLGLPDCLDGLTEQTKVLANVRLASALMDMAPAVFWKYARDRYEECRGVYHPSVDEGGKG